MSSLSLNIINSLVADSAFIVSEQLPMDTQTKVYLHQFNQVYDNSVYLPLSIAALVAAAKADPFIVANYSFAELSFIREPVDQIIAKYEWPCVLGFSIYIWNEQLSLAIAKKAKQVGDCITIVGGPSVLEDSESFLRQHPYIDFLVHGEGEQTFPELMKCLKSRGNLLSVSGISFLKNGVYYKTASRKRSAELDDFPSPFLTGEFDSVIKHPYQFQAIWETNRGCPFSCSFCYWGSNLLAKIKCFSIDRLKEELKWIADNKIKFMYAADANFGIIERDVEIADMIVESKLSSGYPNSFFINYSKNTGERVFEIAKKFHKVGLSKGTTLSLQSLDEGVLELIKRKNIKMSVFRDLQRKYREFGIPSYTEFILPLPGETLESFISGIELTFESGEHDQIAIYLCRLLPNTEMSSPESRQNFGYKSRFLPILSAHASIVKNDSNKDDVPEYEECLFATNTMPVEDWQYAMLFSTAVVSYLCLKSLYFISLYLYFEHNIKFVDFLKSIILYVDNNPDKVPFLAKEHDRVKKHINAILHGNAEVDYDGTGLHGIRWPIEEVLFIQISQNRDVFYNEMHSIVQDMLKTKSYDCLEEVADLFGYQHRRLVDISLNENDYVSQYEWNWPEYFASAILNEKPILAKKRTKSILDDIFKYNNREEFHKFHVWFGRRGKLFYYPETWEFCV